MQFHPEVDDAIHEDWLREWGDELPEYGLSRERLREERASYGPRAQAASAALLGEYLEGLEARRGGRNGGRVATKERIETLDPGLDTALRACSTS